MIDVIAEDRAAGVGISEGSRFRKTERTRPRSGWTSASRRRRLRVIVLAAMWRTLPLVHRAGTWRCEHANTRARGRGAGGGSAPAEDVQALGEHEERARERRALRPGAHRVPVDLL